MFYTDSENNIFLTRGDTGIFSISLTDKDGAPYTPGENDTIRFAMAKKIGGDILINKTFPVDTLALEIEPEETKELPFGSYVYDIELTDGDGHVSTVILAKLKLTDEVH